MLLLWFCTRAIRGRGQQRVQNAEYCLALIYPFGLAVKVGFIGPDWLRWHLADLGFPITIAWLMWGRPLTRHFTLSGMATQSARMRQGINALQTKIGMVIGTVLLAVGYEYACSLLVGHYPDGTLPIGKFDWIDVACYVAGGLLAIALYSYWVCRIRAELPAAREADRKTAEGNVAQLARERALVQGRLNRLRRRRR